MAEVTKIPYSPIITTAAKLSTVPVINGQIIAVQDVNSNALYYDANGVRHKAYEVGGAAVYDDGTETLTIYGNLTDINGAASTVIVNNLTPNRILISDANGKISASSITADSTSTIYTSSNLVPATNSQIDALFS